MVGQDSVQACVYGNETYFFFGDTNRPSYPLGNFFTTGARGPAVGELNASHTLPLRYFQNTDGFVAPMAPMELRTPSTPVWVGGLLSLAPTATHIRKYLASDGDQSAPGGGMYTFYTKGGMTAQEFGLLQWNSSGSQFALVPGARWNTTGLPDDAWMQRLRSNLLGSQATVDTNSSWVYFTSAYPVLRARTSPAALANLSSYEAWTCLAAGATMVAPRLDRDATGKLIYSWKPGTPPVSAEDQTRLVHLGLATTAELWINLTSIGTDKTAGSAVALKRGSARYNAHLDRWLIVGQASPGTVWLAAASTVEGPYRRALLVADHSSSGSSMQNGDSSTGLAYNFYNPAQHDFLDDGSIVYFSGTYATTFAPQHHMTPRYDYNSILYRLDLSSLPRSSFITPSNHP